MKKSPSPKKKKPLQSTAGIKAYSPKAAPLKHFDNPSEKLETEPQ